MSSKSSITLVIVLPFSAEYHELRTKIQYAAVKLGKIFDVVPPQHTSQHCPECHHIDASNRDKEVFICIECGYFADADYIELTQLTTTTS